MSERGALSAHDLVSAVLASSSDAGGAAIGGSERSWRRFAALQWRRPVSASLHFRTRLSRLCTKLVCPAWARARLSHLGTRLVCPAWLAAHSFLVRAAHPGLLEKPTPCPPSLGSVSRANLSHLGTRHVCPAWLAAHPGQEACGSSIPSAGGSSGPRSPSLAPFGKASCRHAACAGLAGPSFAFTGRVS